MDGRWLKVAIISILVTLLAGGAWFYHFQQKAMHHEVERDLAAIARLKADQITAWRKDQLEDAAAFQQDPFLKKSIHDFLAAPDARGKQKLRFRLRLHAQRHDYHDILLLRPDGTFLLGLRDPAKTQYRRAAYRTSLTAAQKQRTPVMVDIHSAVQPDTPHISVVTPLFVGTGRQARVFAALVFINDVDEFLYPLLEAWPTQSRSGETLLVRRDGDHVLFLSEVRHQRGSALELRIPLQHKNVPAVMAVRGKRGFVRGRDYRGVKVVASLREIPAAPWLLVAKIDAEEVLAEWRFRSVLILALIIGMTVLVMVIGAVLRQREKKAHYQALYRSEVALRANVERHSIMLQAIGDAVIATDRDGRIEWLNLSAERLLGWSEQDAQGRRFAEVFHIVEQQRGKTGPNPEGESAQCGGEKADRLSPMGAQGTSRGALERTLQEGETIIDEMLEIETGDGQRKVILNSTAPLKNAQGDIEGAVVVNRDITERQRLQAEINQAQKMESVGRLAGGIAHEHNNMLNVISGFTELALEKIGDDDPLRSDLEEVLGAARRSAAITRKLLAFARRQPVSPQKLDLNETVCGMLNMLKRLIGEAIELQWKPEQALWPVHIDPVQLDQILANLCINARDAIDGVGRIVITTRNVTLDEASEGAGLVPEGVCGDYVLLSVSDDGCGMDEKTRAHLFEPFFTTKDVDVGTGLGLSTVYGIVQQNKGFVTVESAPDAGAIFRIYLPRHTVAQGAGGAAQTAAQNAAVNRSHGETIMLVEDEASVSRLAARILEALGYAVLVAHTPREAIALASAHSGPLHLLLTDVVMPQMNGHVLAARLKQEYSGLKVLFMSGYTADVMAFQPTPDTEIDFIQKPFTLRELGNKVRAVLDR